MTMTVTKQNRELIRAKARWSGYRAEAHLARKELHAAIHQAAADGMSQADIGRILGWPRQRVNTVLHPDPDLVKMK